MKAKYFRGRANICLGDGQKYFTCIQYNTIAKMFRRKDCC